MFVIRHKKTLPGDLWVVQQEHNGSLTTNCSGMESADDGNYSDPQQNAWSEIPEWGRPTRYWGIRHERDEMIFHMFWGWLLNAVIFFLVGWGTCRTVRKINEIRKRYHCCPRRRQPSTDQTARFNAQREEVQLDQHPDSQQQQQQQQQQPPGNSDGFQSQELHAHQGLSPAAISLPQNLTGSHMSHRPQRHFYDLPPQDSVVTSQNEYQVPHFSTGTLPKRQPVTLTLPRRYCTTLSRGETVPRSEGANPFWSPEEERQQESLGQGMLRMTELNQHSSMANENFIEDTVV